MQVFNQLHVMVCNNRMLKCNLNIGCIAAFPLQHVRAGRALLVRAAACIVVLAIFPNESGGDEQLCPRTAGWDHSQPSPTRLKG